MDNKLRIALQKSGRLYDESVRLLNECGMNLDVTRSDSRLRSESARFPLEVFFLRDDDIPGYVADGVADIGIVGENVLRERGCKVDIVTRLGFSRCRLSLAVPRASKVERVADLSGAEIATSYPNVLREYLGEKGISAKIHEISGSVEIAPGLGLAGAICDIVGSGSTLIANGLREIEVVMRSEAVLAAAPKLSDAKRALLERLSFRISSVLRARTRKYVVLNAPTSRLQEIFALLPGIKSPTVVPLAEPGWNAVHSVIEEEAFWEVIESLREAGAQGILVVPIEKMVS